LAVCEHAARRESERNHLQRDRDGKENGLNPYNYLKYLFEQLPQQPHPLDAEALEPFMPWSASLPLDCRMVMA
jgi:hypothetical protein